MKVKNFIYAGLDFIFDKAGRIWFLEANGMTRGFVEYHELYNSYAPVIEIANFMKTRGEKHCILISKRERYTDKHATNKWLYRKLSPHVKLHACYIEDNKSRIKNLVDINGKIIKPDSLLVHDYYKEISNKLAAKTTTINNIELIKFVRNKYKTANLIKKYTKIDTPQSFIIKTRKQLKELLKKQIFKNGFVIKPIEGGEGRGVYVVKDHERKPKITNKVIVQERIIPKLIRRKYWDVRMFMVNGKFYGGIMRESIHRVTNICRGAKAYRVPKRILDKLKKPALEIVSILDKKFKTEG